MDLKGHVIKMEDRTVQEVLFDTATANPQRVLAVFPSEHVSYTACELLIKVKQTAKALMSSGAHKGDCIVTCMSNTSYWMGLTLAAALIGVKISPLNNSCSKEELAYFLNEIRPVKFFCSFAEKNGRIIKVLTEIEHEETQPIFNHKDVIVTMSDNSKSNSFCSWSQFILGSSKVSEEELLEAISSVNNKQDFLLQFTSGSTSRPKGVLISQYTALNIANSYGQQINMNKNDKILQIAPYFHCIGSVLNLLPMIIFGSPTVVVNRFKADLCLQLIKNYEITVISGVPTMYISLLNNELFSKEMVKTLRILALGGAACSQEMFDLFSEYFVSSTVICCYGLTETASLILAPSVNDPTEVRKNSVGKPIEGVSIKVINRVTNERINEPNVIGELLVKGYCVFRGYFNDSQRTKQVIDTDGWLHTGDLVYVRKDGNIHITGRVDDIIEKGGEKIVPQVIEDALMDCLGKELKTNLCVVGIPDRKYGEEIVACVEESSSEAESLYENIDGLHSKLMKKIMKFEIPKYLVLLPVFPRTKSNKIQKNQLRKLVQQKLSEIISLK